MSASGLRNGWVGIQLARKGTLVNATIMSLGVLIFLFTILLFRSLRHAKPQLARDGAQRMCPHCGLITSRTKRSCLECGKPFTAVEHFVS
jgi:hypothetical protein